MRLPVIITAAMMRATALALVRFGRIHGRRHVLGGVVVVQAEIPMYGGKTPSEVRLRRAELRTMLPARESRNPSASQAIRALRPLAKALARLPTNQ